MSDPLHDDEMELNTSSKGIWKTQEVSIASDEDPETVRTGAGSAGKKMQLSKQPWENEGTHS